MDMSLLWFLLAALLILVGLLGTLLPVLPGLPVTFAGPFLGASLGELWHGRQFRMATRVGFGTWLGLLLGAILKLLLAAVMLAIFFAMLLLG